MRTLNRRDFVAGGVLAAVAAGTPALRGQTSRSSAASAESGRVKPVEVHTPLGSLRGEGHDDVQVFRGVPFAEPPVGALRFRPPVAVRSWEGVRDASKFAPASVQAGQPGMPQSEDCLYLNVWTPEHHGAKAALPVFVWIHGGGFTGGASFAPIFNGAEFARQGMVVVTVAYRLGVLGFLDVGPLLGAEYAGSANNALRDLMMALAWVRANIAAFGGDKRRVTIGGESAGAKLTDILMGVPSARLLFHSMISESGGAERIWPRLQAETIAEGFGKQWTASKQGRSLPGLKSALPRDLVRVQQAFLATWPQHFPLRCEIDGELIPRLPVESIAHGSVHGSGHGSAHGKRLLIGTNRDESALFVSSHPQHDATAANLGNMRLPVFDQVYAQYTSVYPEMTVEQRRIRALTAEEYWVPSVRVAEAEVEAGGAVWMYELDFARSGGRYKGEAFHSEDLALVWDKPSVAYSNSPAEAVLARRMNEAWGSFIRGQAPAAPGLPAWPEYDTLTRKTMVLDATSHVEEAPQERELKLWKGVL